MNVPLRALSVLLLALALATPAGAATLSPPIAKTPKRPVGTVLLLPGSGWASPTPAGQRLVLAHVGAALSAARFRAVAIDYEAGPEGGLQSVKAAIATERRRRIPGPLCLYGESSGGHLALLAAQELKGVGCVITFGAPTSFTAFAEAAAAQPGMPGYVWALETIIEPLFGSDAAGWSRWEPARGDMRQPALMMICADDPIVPQNQIAQIPEAETFVAPPGDVSDPADLWVHGTTTAAGRTAVRRRVAEFVDRAPRTRGAF